MNTTIIITKLKTIATLDNVIACYKKWPICTLK